VIGTHIVHFITVPRGSRSSAIIRFVYSVCLSFVRSVCERVDGCQPNMVGAG